MSSPTTTPGQVVRRELSRNKSIIHNSRVTIIAASVAMVLSLLIFVTARLKAPIAILLADRIVPGLGWIEIGLLSIYSVFVAVKLASAPDTRRIRLTIWLSFSIVFFLQFVLGLAGVKELLMTGNLHVPVPAVVIAGPIYRGERFFMPILFICTIILAGPAWCSYLCYFGSWDGLAANRQRRASVRHPFWAGARVAILVIVPAVAVGMRIAGVKGDGVVWAAVGFGVVGLVVSASVSVRRGSMIHCTGYCPLGLLANLLGKISPFRIRLAASCTQCGKCTQACRYGALNMDRIKKRRPGLTCSLCGDCLHACPDREIVYSFIRLDPVHARAVFMGVVAALHACFLGIARI